jgi:PKD repeat protein
MKRTSAIVIAVLFALHSIFGAPSTQAAVSPDGYRDFQFGSSCNSTPTGEKPESKLWWNDGRWWGSLCATDNHYHIFRLDLGTQKWLDTGTLLDDRPTSKADTLWDAANKKLYVASHVFTTSAAPTSTQSNWGRLYRYSYNAGIYTLDTGFPVTVSKGKSESMVLAKASNGILWVTYVESNKVMINHSSGSDTSWGTPYTLPVTGASNLSSDDISANIAFDTSTASPKIGVLWSNQNDKKMYFAWHADADQNDQNWSGFAVFTSNTQNPAAADDHINIKLQSDGRGVYAVTKTSNTSSSAPLIVLVSCSVSCAVANGWSIAEVYKKVDNQTRAILLIDKAHGELNVFSATEGGGSIYRKKSPITNPSFPPGLGDQFVFIRKTASDAKINNPTSTKQNVDSTTGLVVLASDAVARDYLHNYDPLASGTPGAPTANFSGTPTTGTAPLAVSFSDLSSGNPTSWAWDFDNNGTADSTAQNPSFTYASSGVYSVKLTVSNANGSNTLLKTNYITVNMPSGGLPTADFSGTPTTGTAPLAVSFSDLSTGSPTSWAWDFDNNGTVDSIGRNPSFTYASAGTYSVKLTVSNSNGSNTKIKTGYITVNATGSSPIKAITFESGSLVNAVDGVDSTSGSVSLISGGQQLKGLYSTRIPAATSSYLQQSFSAADDVYVSFSMRVNSLPSSAVRIALLSNAGTTVGNIQLMADGRLQLRNASTMIGAYSGPLSVNTIYRIGLHQKKGAGGDAVLEAYLTTDGSAFGSPFAATRSGAWTTAADRLRFGSTAGGALDALFDDIKLDKAALT